MILWSSCPPSLSVNVAAVNLSSNPPSLLDYVAAGDDCIYCPPILLDDAVVAMDVIFLPTIPAINVFAVVVSVAYSPFLHDDYDDDDDDE